MGAGAASTTGTFAAPGIYVLRLAGSDGALSAVDTVTITVLPAAVTLSTGDRYPVDQLVLLRRAEQ